MRQFTNPCNKCLIKACCSTECNDYHRYESFKEDLLFIPNKLKDACNYIKREVKFMYRGEPIFIKFLLTLLLIGEACNVVLLIGLLCAITIGLLTVT